MDVSLTKGKFVYCIQCLMGERREHIPERRQPIARGIEVREIDLNPTKFSEKPWECSSEAECHTLDPVVPRPRGSRRRRGKNVAPISFPGAMVCSAFALLAIFLFVTFMVNRNQAGPAAKVIAPKRKAPVIASASVSGILEYYQSLAPKELTDAVNDTVRGYMESESIGDRLNWVRPVDGLEELMKGFYEREENEFSVGFAKILESEAGALGGVPLHAVLAQRAVREEHCPLNVLPGRDRMLIDWESSVAYGDLSWERLWNERPQTSSQMRVFITPQNYYNFEFADEQRYTSYKISMQNSDLVLNAYLEKGNPSAVILNDLEPSEFWPVNLKLRFLPSSKSKDMVLIDEVLHKYWLDTRTLIQE